MNNHIVFAVSFILSFVNFMIFYSYPFKLEELGIENGVVGLIVGGATVLTLIMRLVSGVLIDRIRPRWALFITAFLYCGSLLLINFNWVSSVIMGRLAQGALLGGMSTLLMYYSIAFSNNAVEKSKNVSMITFFNVLPTCLAPFVALKITQTWGGGSVSLAGLVLFLTCLLFTFVLDIQQNSVDVPSAADRTLPPKGITHVIADQNIRTAVIILALVYVISGTTVTFLPFFLIKKGMKDPSWYFLAFTICMMLPRLFLNKYLPKDSRFPTQILTVCVASAIFGTFSNYLLAGSSLVYIGAVFCGAALGLIYPAVMSYVVCSVDQPLVGTSSSVVAASADIGVIASNVGLGIASVAFGEDTAMILPISTSCIALAFIISRVWAQNSIQKEASL
ncbi:MFS transporter [Pseudomonas sp. S3E12]|uniref:MFS transporter n=1 Tax=Pseudomonas sp. S3E12 TaxID=1873126 RepID=UPI00081C0B0A|nr:MFS transporter [Pseudomonas sp. S3E12]OCW23581.1 MFS transporter [Pseudomonas sp. S3E12]